jgi:predicted nucleotidyltransferase component of viral defense system
MKIIEKANKKGFRRDKLEKDFYLTVLLHYLAKARPEITFKGGTCLNKVYFPYFRLSEDLDFMMSTENPLVNSNGKRQAFAYKMRETMKHIATTL